MTTEQLGKLCRCHHEFSIDDNCIEEVIEPIKLLKASKFDIYAILLYIDHRVKKVRDLSYATMVYKERTRSITAYKFSEDGNEHKQCFDDYLNSLNSLIDSFLSNSFDANKTFIPVDKDYNIIDGSHRVACCLYFNKKVNILRFPDVSICNTNYSTMLSNYLPLNVGDAMAYEASKWHSDLYVLFIWPRAYKDPEKLSSAFSMIENATEVIYHRDFTITYNAIRNLMIQIYGHMDWVGNVDNDFESTYAKADEVWDNVGKCRVIISKAPSCEYILNLKAQVRDIYNIGLASIHSTDNIKETRLALQALLNPNSFHFLTHAKPTAYKKSYKIIEKFIRSLDENGVDKDNIIVDSSMVMAIYGAREANDLDYYSIDESDVRIDDESIEEHGNDQKEYYSLDVRDLILCPNHHFMFNGLKFVAPLDLLEFKKSRYNKLHDTKDSTDIRLIELMCKDSESTFEMKYLMLKVAFKRYKCNLFM